MAQAAGYDPSQYELLLRHLLAGWKGTYRKFDPIPNRKTDTNNHGAFSFDNIGANYAYPEGATPSAAHRRRTPTGRGSCGSSPTTPRPERHPSAATPLGPRRS